MPFLDRARHGDVLTPDFGGGAYTPDFGESVDVAREVLSQIGEGRVLKALAFREEWPRFPMCVLTGPLAEGVRVGEELRRPFPEEPIPFAASGIERR